jgi:hypothetical protein
MARYHNAGYVHGNTLHADDSSMLEKRGEGEGEGGDKIQLVACM